MAAGRLAWVLNLDADLELGARARYAPTKKVLAAMRPHVEALRGSLLGPDDMLVDETTPPDSAKARVGRAFCPTPRALAILRRAGAVPEPHPNVAVLREVNGRAFCTSLGPTLEGGAFVTDLHEAVRKLEGAPPFADAWRIKRAHGMSGRGQRVVRAGQLANDDLVFLRAGLAEAGVQIEPNVTIEAEYGLHGVLAQDGSLELGRIVRQICDARGQWTKTELAAHVPSSIVAAFEDEVRRVGKALSEAGYFGPFGVDGFSYRDARGETLFQPRSEINARYSMGFGIGLRGEGKG
ncbi:hypothetical protein AKJ09_07684 [Labilithrix luteola]|uniref:Uncharacterized protein n=1 Tax=Labilithrix luteola TaxID=1391654 RepID=A0A0K1Q5B1_9BACT|nr:ATP-grasp domain-containing protein [Labilithrix luteola]AKV01021.1 hypothetical protein AKJ09_07684 [Labilithrix luteola]